MGEIYFITGGAASGKSMFANDLAESLGADNVAYIATAECLDREMGRKIALHKKNRNKKWRVYEEPRDLISLAVKLKNKNLVILIECLALLISNLMLNGMGRQKILTHIKSLAQILKERKSDCIVVTNEVGQGIVPENKLAREYREILGKANQIMAQNAGSAYLIVSGIKIKLK